MLKVIHVLNTGKYSGAENVVITIIDSMKKNVDSTYVSLEGSIKEYLDEKNISYFPVKKLTIASVRRVINQIKPDIIHAHDFTAGIICSLTGTKIPIINHIHNNSPWIQHYNFRSLIYALSCYRYKKILTVSNSVMDEYVFGHLFKTKTEVVGNPINIDRIRKLAGDNTTKDYEIAFLGRLSPPKNPHLFLDIIQDIKSEKHDIKVVMIGDGELRAETEKLIIDKNLSDNISLVGFQKNPYRILNESKILLMPSSWEGYGLAAIEALALGIPVVCSNVGGLPEIVDDMCGKVCSEKDEYNASVLKLLDDSTLYTKKSQGAQEKANRLDNLKEYSEKITKTYMNIMIAKAEG